MARYLFLPGLLLLTASIAGAQVDIPKFAGLWCPRTGSAAVYDVVDKLGEVDRIAIKVPGGSQIATSYEGLDSHTIIQRFHQLGGEAPVLEAVTVLEVGLTPRNLPAALWRGGGPPILAVQVGVPIGQETLDVPAGSFDCAHYKLGDADVWLSPRVSPYGLVTYRASGLTLVLASYVENLDGQNR